MARRIFLRRLAAAASLPVVGAVAYGIERAMSGSSPSAALRLRARPGPSDTAVASTELSMLPSGVRVPVAAWVQAENAKPGTLGWIVTGHQVPRAIEGFASTVSAAAGDEVALYVSTRARSFHVEAYRMGYYQGLGGRLVWQSGAQAGAVQPAPTVTPGVNTVSCKWSPSPTFKVDASWPPGAYLLKLVGDGGEQQFVPFCVRDDASVSAFLVQHSVTTWQAYNLWGGYSLYYGLVDGGATFSQTPSGKDFGHRSRIVSFDRPYPQNWAQGSSDFLGNELPLVYDMERLGLDVSYTTDVDVHRHPERVLQHRCLMSLGHDEYWSLEMRTGVAQARDAGVNLAFLGANACYRSIRFESSPMGPERLQVCYKSAGEDPLLGVDDARVTPVTWASSPTSWPESQLLGSTYQDVEANADLVVSNESGWLWAGTGLRQDQHVPLVVQGEYNRFDPGKPGPRNVEVLAHSPVANRGPGHFSDVTWYTVPGGGGVLSVGTASWVNKLADTQGVPSNVLPAAIPGVTEVLRRAMENVYAVLGAGPASASQPSRANWQGIEPVGTPPPAPPTPPASTTTSTPASEASTTTSSTTTTTTTPA
ncbi:MAG: N,N-dimethylformamidase beta subunit family domain-containing protein [Acidimicrobiales bacterium]